MVANLIDRFLGRTAEVTTTTDVSITSLGVGAYTAGDVVNSGGTTLTLQCLTVAKADVVKLTGVSVWENAQAGTRAKAGLRLHFFDTAQALPAQDNPLVWASGTLTQHVGYYDIATGDYVEATDGTDNYAYAHVAADPALRMRTASGSRNLYLAVAVTGTPTFAAGAELYIRFHWGQ